MYNNNIGKAFDDLKPWVTKFTINGITYGGWFDALNDIRIKQFFQYFPNVKTILELGSLEGGHTFALSKGQDIKRVVAIEGRRFNIEKALFVQKLLDVHNVEFINKNLENFNLFSLGVFDAVFCVGILYHLPTPWNLIAQISNVSKNLFVWTHYSKEYTADKTVNGYKGIIYNEGGLIDPLSGMSSESFWPTLDSLKMMLSRYGYTNVHIIENDPNHVNGPCVTLVNVAT